MSIHLFQQWITDIYKYTCTSYAYIINIKVQTDIHTDMFMSSAHTDTITVMPNSSHTDTITLLQLD